MLAKEIITAAANEYAKRFEEIITANYFEWQPTGTLDICTFEIIGEYYCFTLNEIMIVVDNIDSLAEFYGSEKKVGEEVLKWCTFIFGRSRRTVRRYNASVVVADINLSSWLRGCRGYTKANDIMDLTLKREVLYSLMSEYGEGEEMKYILQDLDNNIHKLSYNK